MCANDVMVDGSDRAELRDLKEVAPTAPLTPGAVALSVSPVHTSPIRSIVAASSGNLVEWFDFYIYAFTALYFSAAFFPGGSPTAQLMKSSGVYALGFFARPLGSWIFGRLADRTGRRHSMVIAVLMMCFGSLMVACLPTYASIGVLAPVLLTVARVIQGISVGGEYGTSAAYMSEVARPGRRGFYASFQYVTLIGGQLLATVVLVILQIFLTREEMEAWGWRVPFVIGALAAIVALWLRSSLVETTTAETRAHEHAGTMRGLLTHPRALLIVLGYTAAGSLLFYTFTTYMQKYLVNSAGFGTRVGDERHDGRAVLFHGAAARLRRAVRSYRQARVHAVLRDLRGSGDQAIARSHRRCDVGARGFRARDARPRRRELLFVHQRHREGGDVPGADSRVGGRTALRDLEFALRRDGRVRGALVQGPRRREPGSSGT